MKALICISFIVCLTIASSPVAGQFVSNRNCVIQPFSDNNGVITYNPAFKLLFDKSYYESKHYSVFSVDPSYQGNILLQGCGGQSSAVYNYLCSTADPPPNPQCQRTPVNFNWTGGSSLETGILRYDYQPPCQPTCISRLAALPAYKDVPDWFYPYMKVVKPTNVAEYNIAYDQLYSMSSGATETYKYRGTVVLIIGQAYPDTVKHYHQITANPLFSEPTLLRSASTFNVCADGSQASLFKIVLSKDGQKRQNFGIRIAEDTANNVALYGQFSPLMFIDNNTIEVKYKHPDNIEANIKSKDLHIEIFLLDNPNVIVGGYTLTVWRAPVLMVHGLWSGSESFKKMESELITSGLYPFSIYTARSNLIRRADYSTTNSMAFVANVPKIKTEIELLIKSAREGGIASGNVDYIGHSMGGILGRLYLQSDSYQCGFHKLITINTPHSGSQIANLLTSFKSVLPPAAGILCADIIPLVSFASGEACSSGAIDNLRVDSPEITSTLNGIRRNYHTAPSHTVATVEFQTADEIMDTFEGDDPKPTIPDYTLTPISKKIIKAVEGAERIEQIIAITDIAFNTIADFGFSNIFNGLNDHIVALESQQGGMMGDCTTIIENQAHTGSPENSQVIKRIKNLLIENPSSVSFCPYFNPIPIGQPTASLIIPSGNISIKTPRQGQLLQAGDTGVISATGTNLTEVRAIIEYSTDQIVTTKVIGTSLVCTTPISVETGRKRVIVIGKTASGGYVSDTISFYVVSSSNFCKSIQSGEWTNPNIWSCGHEPTVNDVVTINPGHTVTVSTMTAQALQVNYNSGNGKIQFAGGSAKLFIKGGG